MFRRRTRKGKPQTISRFAWLRCAAGGTERRWRGRCGVFLLLIGSGCAAGPVTKLTPHVPAHPMLAGSYHQVHRGETLWRIAHSYGLDAESLRVANRLPRADQLQVGQRLFIPLPAESSRFVWPLRGSLQSAASSKGLDIVGSLGSLVRASRSGRVAVAAHRLSGWGKTVVIDHLDGYLTIYSGLDQLLVAPGAGLRQGTPIGSLGAQALHFEIRHGVRPKNALALLPRE